MAFWLLFQNLERYELEIFTTGSQCGMLLLPKVSISDSRFQLLKIAIFREIGKMET